MGNSFDGFNADPHEMQRHRDKPLDDAALDQLLDGIGDGPLHQLVMAARAPGTARELAGEEAALAAFRSSRPLRGAAPLPTRRPFVRRLLAIKIGVAAAVVLGGVAIAATTGYLPNPLAPGSDDSPGSTTSPPWWTTSGAGPGGPSASGLPGGSLGPSALPSASLPGLCRAYLAHLESKPDKPWDNSAFAALSALAGGDDKVRGYCTALVEEDDKKPKPSNTGPTPTTRPSATPAGPTTPGTVTSGGGANVHATTGPDGETEQASS